MGIAHYLKEIGRGKKGARDLTREQAADLMRQILQGAVSDAALGAFCMAMRFKGETPQELAGFLDALQARLQPMQSSCSVVVLPSYNGARRQPCLTPLLALLLAHAGAKKNFAVLLHGMQTEDRRIAAPSIFSMLNQPIRQKKRVQAAIKNIVLQAGDAEWIDTAQLSPALARLLALRERLGLRNSAHSLVKMLNPIAGAPALIVSPYTHPEYRESVTAAFAITGQAALLLRGTEGEPVADTRRLPEMRLIKNGQIVVLNEAMDCDDAVNNVDSSAEATAAYTQAVLQGDFPVPSSIAAQVRIITQIMESL